MFNRMIFFPALYFTSQYHAHFEQGFQTLRDSGAKCHEFYCSAFSGLIFLHFLKDNLLLKSSFLATQTVAIAYFLSAVGRRFRNITSRLLPLLVWLLHL